MYKFTDCSNETVAHYRDGTVSFLPFDAVPAGEVIHPHWTEEDEADFNYQQQCHAERDWRDIEMRRVLRQMDQIRNDAEFGSSTYKGGYTSKQLNAYREALCNYPEKPNFPFGERPRIEDVV